MKRLSPRNKFVLHSPLLLVRLERPVFTTTHAFQFQEPFTNFIGRDVRFRVFDSEFKKSTIEEICVNGGGLGVRKTFSGIFDREDSQSGVSTGSKNIEIQGIGRGPLDKHFGAVTPLQAKGRLNHLLGLRGEAEGECDDETKRSPMKKPADVDQRRMHKGTFPYLQGVHKPRAAKVRKGFALIEATLAMSLLSVVGIILLTLSLNIVYPRQYSLQQVLSDAYITFERARAERIPFETLTGDASPWPVFPAVATEEVVIGRLPGGREVRGEVTRTRMADENNYPADGDANSTGTVASNPAAMKIWRVQSILKYSISQRTYVKSRTIVRAQ